MGAASTETANNKYDCIYDHKTTLHIRHSPSILQKMEFVRAATLGARAIPSLAWHYI